MKKSSLVALLALLFGLHTLHADNFATDTTSISITGNITQETNATTGATTTKPLTIANLLGLIDMSGAATDMKYYFDDTISGYVIAAKGSGATGTPLVTILEYGSNYVDWYPTKHSYTSAVSITGFSGDVSGTALQTEVYPHLVTTLTTHFTLFGTINGKQTIIKGTIVHIYK
jgi:hypothetical protein